MNNPKYFNDRDPRWHSPDATYHYPGKDGYPLRMPPGVVPPLLSSAEADKLVVVGDVQVRIFKSWDAQDLAAYSEIVDRCYNGQFRCLRRFEREAEGDAGQKGWLFYVEWAQLYSQLPPGGR